MNFWGIVSGGAYPGPGVVGTMRAALAVTRGLLGTLTSNIFREKFAAASAVSLTISAASAVSLTISAASAVTMQFADTSLLNFEEL